MEELGHNSSLQPNGGLDDDFLSFTPLNNVILVYQQEKQRIDRESLQQFLQDNAKHQTVMSNFPDLNEIQQSHLLYNGINISSNLLKTCHDDHRLRGMAYQSLFILFRIKESITYFQPKTILQHIMKDMEDFTQNVQQRPDSNPEEVFENEFSYLLPALRCLGNLIFQSDNRNNADIEFSWPACCELVAEIMKLCQNLQPVACICVWSYTNLMHMTTVHQKENLDLTLELIEKYVGVFEFVNDYGSFMCLMAQMDDIPLDTRRELLVKHNALNLAVKVALEAKRGLDLTSVVQAVATFVAWRYAFHACRSEDDGLIISALEKHYNEFYACMGLILRLATSYKLPRLAYSQAKQCVSVLSQLHLPRSPYCFGGDGSVVSLSELCIRSLSEEDLSKAESTVAQLHEYRSWDLSCTACQKNVYTEFFIDTSFPYNPFGIGDDRFSKIIFCSLNCLDNYLKRESEQDHDNDNDDDDDWLDQLQ